MNRPWALLAAGLHLLLFLIPPPANSSVPGRENTRLVQIRGTTSVPTTRVYIHPRGVDEQSVVELRKRLIAEGVQRVNLFVPSLIIVCDVPESIDLGTLVGDSRYSLIEESDLEASLSVTAAESEEFRFIRMCYTRLDEAGPGTALGPGPDDFGDVLRMVPRDIVERSETDARLFAVAGAVQERNIQQNSEFLVGDVLVQLVLPESDGHSEDWTDAALADAATGAFAAAVDFQGKFGYAPMHFVLSTEKRVPTRYEPIQTEMGEHAEWIGELMAQLGITGKEPFLMVHEYNNLGRRRYGADWAFTAFIARSENAPGNVFPPQAYTAYAYLGGPCLVIPFPAGSNPNGIDPWLLFSTVFQHEMSHVFWALDEYPGPLNTSQCSSRTGYLSYDNQNKVTELLDGTVVSCPGIKTQLCIMWRAKEDHGRPVCQYTQGQIGVIDRNGNSIPDVFDAEPIVEFVKAGADTIESPELEIQMTAVSQAVPNRNPLQDGESRASYAAPLMDAVATVNSTQPTYLTPIDGKWDETEEDLSITLKGLPVGATEVSVVVRNAVGKASAKYVKKIYFLGIRFAHFSVDPFYGGIRVVWDTVGEDFGAELDLHRIDTSSGVPDTTVLATGLEPGSQSNGEFRSYEFVDRDVDPGCSYRYFVRGHFEIEYSGKKVQYATTSGTYGAQGMFPIPSGKLASNASPNPFRAKTQISVEVPAAPGAYPGSPASGYGGEPIKTPVSITVYDVTGRRVKRVYNGHLFPGVSTFDWNGTNEDNEQVPSGVYFVKTIAGPATEIRKVVVVR